MTTTATAHRFRALGDGVIGEILRSDGTMWSHAASLGTRFKGTEFTIDKGVVENFIRVFRTGYPQKIPIDYEHGTTNGATDAGQPVPKAGGVKELRGVYSVSDFDGDLKAAAEKLAERAGRPLDDPRNFGLWVRWSPTARALQMVKEGEYTEMSITFLDNLPHNVTCEDQGPALVAIALTNLPFLDDMLPVAASRAEGAHRAGTPSPKPREVTQMESLYRRLSARFGKPVATEDEADTAVATELSRRDEEIRKLTAHQQYATVVGAEIGETDPAKAAAKIRELKATADTARAATEASEASARELAADGILKNNEKRLTPALKDYFRPQLLSELKAGTKAGATLAEKAIAALPEITALSGRQSGADTGKNAPTDEDSILADRAEALMSENEQLKELAKTDRPKAYKQALRLAQKEIGTKQTA